MNSDTTFPLARKSHAVIIPLLVAIYNIFLEVELNLIPTIGAWLWSSVIVRFMNSPTEYITHEWSDNAAAILNSDSLYVTNNGSYSKNKINTYSSNTISDPHIKCKVQYKIQ